MGAGKLLRDYAALSLGEVVAKAAGFGAFAYLARSLGPSAYGAVELAVALVMLFVLVVQSGLGTIGTREIIRDRERAVELARLIPGARLLLAAIACAGMLACIGLMDQPPETRRLLRLYAVSLLAAPWTLGWLLQALDRMRLVALAQPVRMAVFLLGVLVFVKGPRDLWKVGAVEIAAAAATASYYFVVCRRYAEAPGLAFDRSGLASLLREALPLGVSQLLLVLNQSLPILLMALFVDEQELAFFGGARRIVISLDTFAWLYFFNLYPSIVRSTVRGDGNFTRQAAGSFRATSWLGVLVALLGTLLAEPICRLAYGSAFAPAATPLALLLWILPVQLLSGHARYGLIGAGYQTRELIAQAVGIIVTLAVGLALVPRLGGTGAALAALASALVIWFVTHRLAIGPVGKLPFAGPLLRPGVAAIGALAVLAWLPEASPWLRAGAALVFYLLAARVLEPLLWRDLRSTLERSR